MTTLVRIHRYGRSPISIRVVWYAHGERQEAILPKGATVITETTADATAPELRIDGRRVLPPWALSLNGRHVLSNRALELRDPNPENLESLTEDPRDAMARAGAGSAAYLNPEGTDFEPRDEYEARIRSENTAEYERELTDPERRITRGEIDIEPGAVDVAKGRIERKIAYYGSREDDLGVENITGRRPMGEA